MLKSLINTRHFIANHPLCQEQPGSALVRYLRWQIGSRMLTGSVQMPFVNDSILVVAPGMTGATLNIYTGLSDFADGSLLLHLLRRGDLFVDVGANVGVYTVLAGAAAGADCIAVEPIPTTFAKLRANVRANVMGGRVETLNIGLGRADDVLHFTSDRDCQNRAVREGELAGETITASVRRLDDLLAGRSPTLIKIDVEGFESEVLAGAERTLRDPALLGVIVEMDAANAAFNPNELAVHTGLSAVGFAAYTYDPFSRRLTALPSKNRKSANTIYLRDLAAVEARLRAAAPFRVIGQTI